MTDVINIVKQYVTKLSSSGVDIYKAYLFGSYARNEATELSDIDVLIVSEAYNIFNLEKKAKAWAITAGIDSRIEPHTIGTEKYFSTGSIILNEALKEGIEIKI
jgi:predicted nucleotidyltransferase